MKGYLRVYEDGETFVSKLSWAVIYENYLNFYEDRKSSNISSFLSLSGAKVKKIFNESYNVNMIEITTPGKHSILFVPENIKDIDKWKLLLEETSKKYRDSFEDQSLVTKQNNERDVPVPSNDYYRKSSQPYRTSNPSYPSKDGPILPNKVNRQSLTSIADRESSQLGGYRKQSQGYYDLRDSHLSAVSQTRLSRAIETVKEDPMMNDDEIFETKPLEELRRKYPITDKAKRWSIAATDLVGKTNDELFLMLIQLNREKAHMDIWKETLEQYISEVDEKLKEPLSMHDVNELEENRNNFVEQLNNIEYMMNLAHPLISFMDAVVQMSDAYGGNNEAFHVAYHKCPPTGKEDFSNIEFLRHNQEKQVAKLINENKNPQTSLNSQTFNSLYRDNGSDKENEAAVLLGLDNSEEFIEQRMKLNDIISEITSQFEELEPSKKDIENFIKVIDVDLDSDYGKNTKMPVITSKGSMKSIKSLKGNDNPTNNSAFMPRRSTRKAPKSDMAPSINRKQTLKSQGTLGSRSQNASLRHVENRMNNDITPFGMDSNTPRRSFHSNISNRNDGYSNPTKVQPLSLTPRSQKSNSPSNNFSEPIGRSSSSNVQNQLRDLLKTDPYEEKRSPSPIYRAPSSIVQVPESGPLLTLNTGLFQNVHGPRRTINNNNVVCPPSSRGSMTDSEISFSPRKINQRLNLNQSFDDNKNWKNPGLSSPGRNGSNLLTDNGEAQRNADRLIDNILSTPEKVNIGERYRSSIVDDDEISDMKSRKVRQLIANESFSRLTKEDGGRQYQRESKLMDNARLAQEASRKSRELQNY